MKKKTDKYQKPLKEVEKVFCQYLEKLNVNGYRVYTKLVDEVPNKENVILAVDVQLPYKEISFEVTKRFLDIRKQNKYNTNHFLIHEAVHVFLGRYTKLANDRFVSEKELVDEEETLTDDLAFILNKLWK